MGLIKAAIDSANAVIGDQFKEFVQCPQVENNILVQRGVVSHGKDNKTFSEGVISNGSAIVVPQGMAMMIVDNGKIVEFSAEPGTFTWDTSTEPSVFTGGLGKGLIDSIKTVGSRITFGGQTAKDQRVYYVNIKTIPAIHFGSGQPKPLFDPFYQSIEVIYNGDFAIRIDDPVILINNVVGSMAKDSLTFDDIFGSPDGVGNQLTRKFSQNVIVAISKILDANNIPFTKAQSYVNDITTQMNEILNSEWHEKYGIIVTDVALDINPSDESREIMKNLSARAGMGATYSANMPGMMAAAAGESMQNAASNPNGAMMGFMGMNMAQQNGMNMMNAFAQPQQQAAQPQAVAGVVAGSAPADANAEAKEAKFCPNCGAEVNGKFCSQCGTQL